ncbi:MAG: hypothetical protein ABID09_04195, partial [Candidatus Omnitrophota bacterium]
GIVVLPVNYTLKSGVFHITPDSNYIGKRLALAVSDMVMQGLMGGQESSAPQGTPDGTETKTSPEPFSLEDLLGVNAKENKEGATQQGASSSGEGMSIIEYLIKEGLKEKQ